MDKVEFETKKLVAKAIIEFLNNHDYEMQHSGVSGVSYYYLLDKYRNDLEDEIYGRTK